MAENKKKILVVEDDKDTNAAICTMLEQLGYEHVSFGSAKEALVGVKGSGVALALLDIMMPEMNGYETTKAIRNLPERPDGKEIPIIAMTANAFAEDVQAALKAGMDDHVAKPIDMSILISVITKYIEQ